MNMDNISRSKTNIQDVALLNYWR